MSGSNRSGSAVPLALAALLFALLLPAPAGATIYCVADPSCPPGSIAQANPKEAIEAADLNAAPDTVRIGPGEFSSGSLNANTEVDIVGAGPDQTRIVAEASVFKDFVAVVAPGSSISGLELRLTEDNTRALRLSGGADVSDLWIRAAGTLKEMVGIFIEQEGTEATRLDIRLGPNIGSTAITSRDRGVVTDSFLQARLGIEGGEDTTIAKRLHIRAATPVLLVGRKLTIRDSLLEPHPESTTFYGADVLSSNSGPETPGALIAVNVTIVGNGESGTGGVLARGNTGNAQVNLLNSVVANVANSLWRVEEGGDDADITVRYSSYDASKTMLAGAGTGTDILENNLTGATDSGFVNAAASDYRLRPDSVLVDAGHPVAPTNELDLRRLARTRDGDGDGDSRTDIGAYEYQRVPPSPAFSFAPAAPLFGDLVTFDAAGTGDVDGDPLSLTWSFGDGGTAAGAQASHLYALPGAYEATLTATDSTGLSASAADSVGIGLRAGRCANRRRGTARADTLNGFAAGDRLDGLRGNDVLRGNAGDDCLYGGAGRDRLKGGKGRDLLKGGGGNDVLDVRGGGRDRADCGPGGRDLVLAGKGDKLRRCERIGRGKKAGRRAQKM